MPLRPCNDLAAVRIFAATAVLHAHAWYTAVPGLKTEDFLHVFAFTLDFQGVHAFFILSGLLLTRSLIDRPDALRFTVARLTRYVPAILVSALFAALVIGPLVTSKDAGAYFTPALAGFVMKITTLADVNAALPGVFDRNPEPGILFIPLWTIHYELVFAVVLAVIGALGLLRFRRLVLFGLVATLAVNVVWFWNGEEHLALGGPHHLVRFCSTFGIGIAMGVFADRIPVSSRMMLIVTLVAVPLGFTNLAAIAGMALLAYAIIWIGFCAPPLAATFARLGVWSYGFYVWGYLIEQTVVYALPGVSAWAVFALSFPIALAAGWASWVFVERPSIAQTSAIASAIRRALSKVRTIGREASPTVRPD
ncbi:acyltransferase family protein [Chenggangzhangella methanolivorans]|uniref:Acyltransferase n=1 Tax=Chenggangzhangella methanolivorans TaxID=1437009 RepID=A0A9E6RA52_9HYPH|nr:acyltransferase [Chenggangzhangella methanolivorans]QZO00387.1 acyltransferase [Chenggangzhangella methanolivorans]